MGDIGETGIKNSKMITVNSSFALDDLFLPLVVIVLALGLYQVFKRVEKQELNASKPLISNREKLPPELGETLDFVDSFFDFVDVNCSFSVWRLTREISTKLDSTRPVPSEKCAVLSNFYGAYQSMLRNTAQNSQQQFALTLQNFNSVIRTFESCLSDLIGLVAVLPDRSSPVIAEYGTFCDRYNLYIGRYEQFLKRVKQPMTFTRARTLANMPAASPSIPKLAERAYGPGADYDVYKDLSTLLSNATKEIFVIESYPNEQIFDLYLEKAKAGIPIRLLTSNPKDQFIPVGKKFCNKQGIKMEARQTQDMHGRMLFIDGRCWAIGQSMKDAAIKKPTYLVELEDVGLEMKGHYELLWKSAKLILPSSLLRMGRALVTPFACARCRSRSKWMCRRFATDTLSDPDVLCPPRPDPRVAVASIGAARR